MPLILRILSWSHIVIFIGVFLTAVGGLGQYYLGKLESEKKDRDAAVAERKLQDKLNALKVNLVNIEQDTSSLTSIKQTVDTILLQSSDKAGVGWKEIEMIKVAVWFPGRSVDFMFLLFQSSSGIIRGNVRVKGADEIYSFSTDANTSLPVAIRNLWLQEKNQFQSFPVIEYKIMNKTDENATLNIIMSSVHVIGETKAINLESPVKMIEK